MVEYLFMSPLRYDRETVSRFGRIETHKILVKHRANMAITLLLNSPPNIVATNNNIH